MTQFRLFIKAHYSRYNIQNKKSRGCSAVYEKLKPVGKRIQDARKAIGMTQADLADKLDISVSHMSSIETGRANFGVETLMKITEILQVSADSLLRTDIPEVSVIYAGDLDALLKDCTAEEVESMMNMLRQMKTALIKARPTEN